MFLKRIYADSLLGGIDVWESNRLPFYLTTMSICNDARWRGLARTVYSLSSNLSRSLSLYMCVFYHSLAPIYPGNWSSIPSRPHRSFSRPGSVVVFIAATKTERAATCSTMIFKTHRNCTFVPKIFRSLLIIICLFITFF